jgi:hypothetical protein
MTRRFFWSLVNQTGPKRKEGASVSRGTFQTAQRTYLRVAKGIEASREFPPRSVRKTGKLSGSKLPKVAPHGRSVVEPAEGSYWIGPRALRKIQQNPGILGKIPGLGERGRRNVTAALNNPLSRKKQG